MNEMKPRQDSSYQAVQDLYLGAGPHVPIHEMPADLLRRAHDRAVHLTRPTGQEMCGWINVERSFLAATQDEAAEVTQLAYAAFGNAYDMYEEEGAVAGLFRLQLIRAHLGQYDLYAQDEPIPRDLREESLNETMAIGRRILDMYDNDPSFGPFHDTSMSRVVAKVVATLALGIRGGDTRKPNVAMATLPATMRQEKGIIAHGRAKTPQATRGSWSLNIIKSTRGGWQDKQLLLALTDAEVAQPPVAVADKTDIGVPVLGTNGLYTTLRSMVVHREGRAAAQDVEHAQTVGNTLQRLIKGKKN